MLKGDSHTQTTGEQWGLMGKDRRVSPESGTELKVGGHRGYIFPQEKWFSGRMLSAHV